VLIDIPRMESAAVMQMHPGEALSIITTQLEALTSAVRLLTGKVSTPEHHTATRQNDKADAICPELHNLAKTIYKSRRSREKFLDRSLIEEPAWDILLDIYSHQAEGKPLGVTSSCIAACVPATTALRWISVLEKQGIIERYADNIDKRRTYLRLTSDGTRVMNNALRDIMMTVWGDGRR
jgi:DNA-binding MarR family transcriptional regulator